MKNTVLFIKTISLLVIVSVGFIGVIRMYRPNLISSVKRQLTHKKRGIKPNTKAIWGVDLSHHQGKVNWSKIKDLKPGFAFIKVTEGSSHTDKKYKKYQKEIRSKKILMGSYHFFSYSTTGEKQARHFIKHINLKKGDLPPVLDAELKKRMPANSKVSKELLAFIKTVEKELKVKPIIYCTDEYYTKYLKGKLTGSYVLWICDFRNEPTSDYSFWQKTDRLDIPGFKGLVDYSVFNGSYDELLALTVR